jgi:hypothetical protein
MRVLVIIISHELNGLLDNIQILKQFMDQSGHTVDYAAVSSGTDFSNYEHILPFKYKFTCYYKQLTKICKFIQKFKAELDYDWYIKTRPEIKLLEPIVFSRMMPGAINARARFYVGNRYIKNGLSIPSNLPRFIGVVYSSSKEEFVLDDQLYIFDHSIISGAYFEGEDSKLYNSLENEWFHTKYWKTQNTPLNIIGLNLLFTKAFYQSDDILPKKGIVVYGLRRLGK